MLGRETETDQQCYPCSLEATCSLKTRGDASDLVCIWKQYFHQIERQCAFLGLAEWLVFVSRLFFGLWNVSRTCVVSHRRDIPSVEEQRDSLKDGGHCELAAPRRGQRQRDTLAWQRRAGVRDCSRWDCLNRGGYRSW